MRIALFTKGIQSKSVDEYIKANQGVNFDIIAYDKTEQLKDYNYDLAIMHFPTGVDEEGRNLALFKLNSRSKCPILAAVEKASSREILTLLNYGADDYIMVPCELEDIKGKVINLVREKRVMNLIEENE